MFICECGKEFEKANSFNAHKSHCKEHYLAKYGNLDYYNETHKTRSVKAGKVISEKSQEAKQQKLLIWISEKHTCEKCGQVMTEKYGSGRFCSRACANSHTINEAVKLKISHSVCNSEKYQEHLKTKQLTKHINPATGEKLIIGYCKLCNKPFYKQIPKTGYCSNCLKYSDECFELRSKWSKETRDRLRAEGKQFGFPTRNITSYPEQFWETVLDNNNIMYEREVKELNNNSKCYFLDFVITIGDIKLDLEIDGQQHRKPERVESDRIRDEFLKDKYLVYRISWNEINSEKGSLQMKEKIDKFLEFYNNLLYNNM